MLLPPRKRFGQNFLHDPGSIARIIAAIAPTPDQHLVEIGPGRGAITRDLLKKTGKLDVVELDRDLLQPLTAYCAGLGQLNIYNADALSFNFCSLLEGEPPNFLYTQSAVASPLRNITTTSTKLRVVGNLPYNISTPLLFHLLDQATCITDLHLLLQKEVVARMAAHPGSKTYGRLSVMVQVRCAVQRLFNLSPGAFWPVPKVESSFVRLSPYPIPLYQINNQDNFAKLVAQAFSQRRKTLRNAVRTLLSDATIAACGLDGGLRTEQLSVADFVTLSNCC